MTEDKLNSLARSLVQIAADDNRSGRDLVAIFTIIAMVAAHLKAKPPGSKPAWSRSVSVVEKECAKMHRSLLKSTVKNENEIRAFDFQGYGAPLQAMANLLLDAEFSHTKDEHASEIARLYELVIAHSARVAGKAGYYTPLEIGLLIRDMLGMKDGATARELAADSGGFLRGTADTLDFAKLAADFQTVAGLTAVAAKHSALAARMDLKLHGHAEDVLYLEQEKGQFDFVLANPPFSLPWEPDRLPPNNWADEWGALPPERFADFAFIIHGLESLKASGGKAAFIVPRGLLSRMGSEARIRESIIAKNLLDAVIALPPGLFPATNIPVNILLFETGRKRKDVLFIDATRNFEFANRATRRLRVSDVERITKAYHEFKTIHGYASRITSAEITRNKFDFNVHTYVRGPVTEPVSLTELGEEILQLETRLSSAVNRLDQLLSEDADANYVDGSRQDYERGRKK